MLRKIGCSLAVAITFAACTMVHGQKAIVMPSAQASAIAAQGQTAAVFLPGMRASTISGAFGTPAIINKPIVIPNALGPNPTLTSSTSFFGNFFHMWQNPGFPPKIGQSALPPPSAFPTYKNNQVVQQQLQYPNLTSVVVPGLTGK